jgi:peptidoglycan/LPS O-acetylase OafA/YrhL
MCLLATAIARLPIDPIALSLLLLALTLPPSLAASALMHRWIERPGIALGRRLVARLGVPRASAPAADQ